MSDALLRAAALVPAEARNDAGCSVSDVLEYLDHNEFEVALGLLEDFDGISWQTPEFWDLMIEAAQRMRLDTTWLLWRGRETRQGLLRVDLELAHDAAAVATGSRLWDLGDGVPRPAALSIESMPELAPGGRATARLLPDAPEAWHLAPGDVITMYEQRSVAGMATVVEYARVGEPRQRDR